MNNSDKEYELFKLLCKSRQIKKTDENKLLLSSIEEKGLKLCHSSGKYYINNEVIPLSEKRIRKRINSNLNESIRHLEVLYQTSSTNKIIAEMQSIDKYSILLTEFQNDGQGRRDKQWCSPLAENIYLSIKFNLVNPKNVHLIPLLTALSICNSLIKLGVHDCSVKWPNDIYLSGKKLAGILVESRYNKEESFNLVVGIGLNVNMESNNKIDQLWTSLRIHQNKLFDRNTIISALLSDILESYNKISKVDLSEFLKNWQLHDYLYGSKILITDEQKSYTAIAQGISSDGALLILESDNVTLKKIYSADVSVKRKHNKDREIE